MPNITNKDCERKVEKQVKLFDAKCSGLYVSISPKGAMFNFKYFDRNFQKQRTVEVGLYDRDTFQVEDARAKADNLRSRAAGGESIADTLRKTTEQKKRDGKTVNQLIDEYEAWVKTEVKKPDGELRPRLESWQGAVGYLRRYTGRALGTMIASEIENDHIAIVQADIVAGKYGKPSVSGARGFRTNTSAMFNWAAEAGRKYVKINPCHNLPKLDKEPVRERVLSAAEIKTLWWGLDDPELPCSRVIALALKFELVTMLRSKEYVTATPDELLDLGTGNARLIVPLKRVKKRRNLVVPMSTLAQEIIAEARTLKGGKSPYVFPGKFEGKPLDEKALAHAVRGKVDKKTGKVIHPGILHHLKMAHWTPHDLRRTCATLAGDLGFSEADIAKCLDHRLQKGDDAVPTVTGVYVHTTRTTEKKQVLDAVAAKIREIVGAPTPALKIAA